jgi:hypothetical protein
MTALGGGVAHAGGRRVFGVIVPGSHRGEQIR